MGHYGVALLGAGHRLHHVARERRVQIAEKADAPAVFAHGHQNGCRGRFCDALRLDRLAVFIHGSEPFPVEEDVGTVFPAQHRVWLRAGRYQNRFRGHPHRLAGLRLQTQGRRLAIGVQFHFFRRQAFREADAFLERFVHFFVVERVAGRIDQPAPVRDGHASP